MGAIEIRGLVKRYGGHSALDGLDLEVAEGAVFGFLGPNGAGKTTTTRILAGLARATGGSVRIFGHGDLRDPSLKSRIGYLPDVPAFYEWMRADEYLRFVGELFSLPAAQLDERVSTLLEAAGLSGVKTKIGGYSRGMRQRLGIAQAFVNDPDLLILDEPTSALDPIGRKEVLEMIESLSEKKTVFFSTHILADAERVCDAVAIIDKGRLVLQENLATIKEKSAKPSFLIEVDDGAERLAEKLRPVPWLSSLRRDDSILSIDVEDVGQAQIELAGIIAELRLPVRRLELKEMTLEDIFVKLVEKGPEEKMEFADTTKAVQR